MSDLNLKPGFIHAFQLVGNPTIHEGVLVGVVPPLTRWDSLAFRSSADCPALVPQCDLNWCVPITQWGPLLTEAEYFAAWRGKA